MSFAGAIKSGVAGLDERVAADAGKPTQNGGSSNGRSQPETVDQEKSEETSKAPSSTEERYPHHDHVVEEVSFKDAIKSGVAGLDPKISAEAANEDGKQDATDSTAKPSKADKKQKQSKATGSEPSAEAATEAPAGDERYPHHDHVVKGVNFADAIKSGVAGLDDRVSVDNH